MSDISWNTAERKEIMLIEYEDVIKSVSTSILKKLQQFESTYSEYIYYPHFKDMDEPNLIRTSMMRHHRNVLEFLKINDEFDAEESLKYLIDIDDVYQESPELKFCNVIDILKYEKGIEIIYIYSEKYDPRIHFDLANRFNGNNKVKYIWGPIDKVFEEYQNITSFILSDGNKVQTLMDNSNVDYREIMLAEYGYNMTIDESTGSLTTKFDSLKYLVEGKVFKFGLFSPVDFDKTYFTDVRPLPGSEKYIKDHSNKQDE